MRGVDLTGQRFGRLFVVKATKKRDKSRGVIWLCLCDCGCEREIASRSLRSAKTKSCGCITRERSTRHGMYGTAENAIWRNMLYRCTNSNAANYKYYGGRDICVCSRWKNSFEAFYADMGSRPDGLSLERIDNEQGYSSKNCKWATSKERANNKRNTIK